MSAGKTPTGPVRGAPGEDEVEDTAGIEPGPDDEAQDRAIGRIGAKGAPDDDDDDDEDAGPHSLDEWRAHFATLDGASLWEKAIQANSIRFVRQLQAEGRSAAEVHQIFIALAQRFDALEQHGPEGGLYDWDVLLADGRPS